MNNVLGQCPLLVGLGCGHSTVVSEQLSLLKGGEIHDDAMMGTRSLEVTCMNSKKGLNSGEMFLETKNISSRTQEMSGSDVSAIIVEPLTSPSVNSSARESSEDLDSLQKSCWLS